MRLIITIFFLTLMGSAYAQDSLSTDSIIVENETPRERPVYWRTISFSNLSGVTVSGYFLTTFSMAISYEVKNNWSLNSWSGINYNYSYRGGWASTQFTANKQLGKFNLGAGMMYGAGAIGSPFPDAFYMNDLSFIFTASRRFRLP